MRLVEGDSQNYTLSLGDCNPSFKAIFGEWLHELDCQVSCSQFRNVWGLCCCAYP
ncbi:MAG: hypothetical protein QXK32_04215 [Candidatus Jordarchaeales archaeon]